MSIPETNVDSTTGTPTDATDANNGNEIDWEKRAKDNQANYSKGQVKIKEVEAENALLKEQLGTMSAHNIKLSEEEARVLNDLKFDDPDKWRVEVNRLEQEARANANQSMNEVTAKARQEAEMERRQGVLAEFSKANPDFVLNDEILAKDVPPRITEKLTSGQTTFEDFLTEVHGYLGKGKTVANPETLGQPNLSNVAGGSSAGQAGANADARASYNSELY
jgi:hypothetical protein